MPTDAYVNLTLANPLVPEEAMGAFIGENPNGTSTPAVSMVKSRRLVIGAD